MRSISFILLFFSTSLLYSQSYVGTLDNYSGIHNVTFNPANIVNTPYKADINLVSASGFGGSDYFGISATDILDTGGGFDFDEDVKKFPKDDNTFFFNADVLGPSFMFNLNTQSSIAVFSRARAFLNINNISGELYEHLEDGFDEADDFTFSMEDLNGTIHAWAEIGVTYARILKQTDKNLLYGGISLKYLSGAGAAFFNSPMLSGQYDSASNMLATSGTLSYGLSQEDFEPEDIEFNNMTSGFGIDLGLSYQWNDKEIDSVVSSYYTPHKLKLGVSVTDIGSINYKNGETTQYDMNQTVNADIFDEEDLEQVLEDNYNGVTTISSNKIKLPTALHIMADYKIKTKLYASFNADFAMVSSKKHKVNSVINTVTLTPRFQTKWLSVYSPLSLRQYGDFAWGFGFRAGPLMVGSGSVLSNLISNSTKTTDVYVGLKIPLYRKLNK